MKTINLKEGQVQEDLFVQLADLQDNDREIFHQFIKGVTQYINANTEVRKEFSNHTQCNFQISSSGVQLVGTESQFGQVVSQAFSEMPMKDGLEFIHDVALISLELYNVAVTNLIKAISTEEEKERLNEDTINDSENINDYSKNFRVLMALRGYTEILENVFTENVSETIDFFADMTAKDYENCDLTRYEKLIDHDED